MYDQNLFGLRTCSLRLVHYRHHAQMGSETTKLWINCHPGDFTLVLCNERKNILRVALNILFLCCYGSATRRVNRQTTSKRSQLWRSSSEIGNSNWSLCVDNILHASPWSGGWWTGRQTFADGERKRNEQTVTYNTKPCIALWSHRSP